MPAKRKAPRKLIDPISRNVFARPTGDILVIAITFTVCFGVLASGATVAALSLFSDNKELITVWVSRVTGLMQLMIGLLAGFLAGRGGMVYKSDEGTQRYLPDSDETMKP